MMRIFLPNVLAIYLALVKYGSTQTSDSENYADYLYDDGNNTFLLSNEITTAPSDTSSTYPFLNKSEGVTETLPESNLHVTSSSQEGDDALRLLDKTCGVPPFILHATLVGGSGSSFPVGALLSYKCDFGYKASGSITNTQCLPKKDGTDVEWRPPRLVCVPMSCGDPGLVLHGHRIGSLFTFPHPVSFECEEGFQLVGSSSRFCQTNGKWSGSLPECMKVVCEHPNHPDHGTVSYTSLAYGSDLQYHCDEGYMLKPKDQVRSCLENGAWSGQTPKCQEVECEWPVAPQHGSVQFPGKDQFTDKSNVGSVAIFTCDENYLLIGNSLSKCLDIGEWTFPVPNCVEPCTVPEILHGKVGVYQKGRLRNSLIFKEFQQGAVIADSDKLFLRCENQYEPLGKPNTEEIVTCKGGVWSTIPKCEPAECRSIPPQLRHGRVRSAVRTHRGSVVYDCNENFKKTKYGNVTCNYGKWTGYPPVCSDTRCYFDQLSYPGLKKDPGSLPDTRSFRPVCEEGYHESGIEISCDKGTWKVPQSPCTEDECTTSPPSIENGHVENSGQKHGFVPHYRCDTHFRLRDSPNNKIRCHLGQWIGKLPTCKDTRCFVRDLTVAVGLSADVDSYTFSGEYLHVLCEDGFSSSHQEPFCQVGKWTETSTACEPNDCIVSNLKNGEFKKAVQKSNWRSTWTEVERVRVGEKKAPGTKLHVTCINRASFQGDGSNNVPVICEKGHWNPIPICLKRGETVATTRSPVTQFSSTKSILPTPQPILQVFKEEKNNGEVANANVGLKNTEENAENGNVGERNRDKGNVRPGGVEQGGVGQGGIRQGNVGERKENRGNVGQGNVSERNGVRQGDVGQGGVGQGNVGQGDVRQRHVGQGDVRQGHVGQGGVGQGNVGEIKGDKGNVGQGSEGEKNRDNGNVGQEGVGQKNVGERNRDKGNVGQGNVSERNGVKEISAVENIEEGKVDNTHVDEGNKVEENAAEGNVAVENTEKEKSKEENIRAETTEHSTTDQEKSGVRTTGQKNVKQENVGQRNIGDKFPERKRTEVTNTERPCFCQYQTTDPYLVATVESRILRSGDQIARNKKVKFHCSLVGFYKFRGPEEVTCQDCLPWRSYDLPVCAEPNRGDAVIQIGGESDISPGGILRTELGKETFLYCSLFASPGDWTNIHWRLPSLDGTASSEMTGVDGGRVLVLKITGKGTHQSGKYQCEIGSRFAVIDVQGPEAQCLEFVQTKDMDVFYDHGLKANSSAIFSCTLPSQKLTGKSVLTCLSNGAWSDAPPYCRTVCGKLNETEGLRISYSNDLEVESVATFHCIIPYIRYGQVFATCGRNGKWSHIPPICELPKCIMEHFFEIAPSLVIPFADDVTSPTYPYNSTLRLTCENDLILLGDQTTTCNNRGQWTVPKSQCTVGCRPIPGSPGLIVDPLQTSYRLGDAITFTCEDEMVLDSSVVRMMCVNKGWSPNSAPTCLNNEEK